MRANLLKKIETLKEELTKGGRSTYCNTRNAINLKAAQRELDIFDSHGDLVMIQQMRFEHFINQ